MPFLVSPGVQVTEKDYTSVVSATGQSTGAFAGAFQWGPVSYPTMISTENMLVSVFGKPVTANATSFFPASNFLAYANALWVTRVDTTAQLNAVSKSGATGVKITNIDTYTAGKGTSWTFASHGVWAGKYPGTYGNSIRVSICDDTTWANWQYKANFDTSPSTGELHIVVVDADGRWTGAPGTVLEKFGFLNKASDAKNSSGVNSYYADYVNTYSQYVFWVAHPTNAAGAALNWGSTLLLSNQLITQTTAAGLAATAAQTLSASNASILPGMSITGTNIPAGTYVVSISGTALVMSAAATGTTSSAVSLSFSQFQSLSFSPYTVGASAVAGATSITLPTGIATSIIPASPTTGYVLITGTGIADGTYITSYTTGTGVTTLSQPITGALTSGTSVVNVSSGTGIATLNGGVDDFTGGYAAAQQAAYRLYANDQKFDIALIITGSMIAANALDVIQNVAEVRKDCIAFISPQSISTGGVILESSGTALTDTIAFRQGSTGMNSYSSSYGFIDGGWKYMYDRYNDAYRWVPLNGDTAGLVARAEFTDDAWFSPGGFNRGQVKGVVKLAYNPGKADRDVLYAAQINPVVSFPGSGVILYGDKTALTKPSAFDRINVRRLFIILEKAIATAAKFQLFEFNDQFTQANFRNMVIPFLKDVQGRRGITNFKVICDSTNNTQQVVDTNNFVADIFIAPSRSINFINLSFVATRTGVNFSEIGA